MNDIMTWRERLIIYLKGMAMGTADIIPGVSGGTMAFILGIYERLLAAIRAVNWTWFSKVRRFKWAEATALLDIWFLIPLIAGIISAFIVFTRVIPLPLWLNTHPELVYGLFFGLIAGSVWVLLTGLQRDTQNDKANSLFTPKSGALLAVGIIIGLLVVNLVPADTPDASWFYFICGMVAISAMLLPGISGSFILLILGKYAAVLEAISEFNLHILFPFAFGCGVGLMGFARIIGYCIGRWPHAMVKLICGLLIGTLYAIWPFQERVFVTVSGKQKLLESTPIWPMQWQQEEWLAVGLMLLGVALVIAMARWAATHESSQAAPLA